MKKIQKRIAYLIVGIICVISYLFTYNNYHSFSIESIDTSKIENLSIVQGLQYIFFSEEFMLILSVVLPIIIFVVSKKIIRFLRRKEDEDVTKTSSKIQDVIELNNFYHFKEIKKLNRVINEREYSRKSLDRAVGNDIIKYHIENDIDSFRTDIENSMYNLELLNSYNNNLENIIKVDYDDETKYSLSKFKRVEKRVLNNLIIKKENFLITVELNVFYRSNSGKIFDSRTGKRTFEELKELYLEWKNGHHFEETQKQERKIMNDDIRYNVLKRDNFTCQICGATAKDGAKLHVDHIVPISKGGKTVMYNLQTLCERCNKGKSNKTDDDFKKNMICPKCGSKLVIRNSKYGKFVGCSNYPKCHYKKN